MVGQVFTKLHLSPETCFFMQNKQNCPVSKCALGPETVDSTFVSSTCLSKVRLRLLKGNVPA